MNLRRILPALTVALLLSSSVFAGEQQEIVKLVKQGQYPQALERADKFLASNPRDAQVRFQKGLILVELGRTTDAIRVFTQLSEDYPELPEPYNNLAVLYASQNQLDKSRQALEMAIQTHPSYAVAHENLGDIYAKMASQAYDKALQLDKNNAGAQTKLSLIRELFTRTGVSNPKPTAPATAAPAPVAVAAAPKPAAPVTPAPIPLAPPLKQSSVSTPLPAPIAAAPAVKPPAPAKPVVVAEVKPEPKPEPKPEVKPEPKPAKAAEAPKAVEAPKAADNAESDDVLRAVNGWAKAWAGQKVPVYLGYYGKAFQPPKGESRSSWEASRKDRISRPKSIDVDVDSPKIKFNDDGRAVVTFTQHYRSDSLKTSTGKTLVLAKNNGKWLIVEERVGR